MKPLLIVGTGGHARAVASVAVATKKYRIAGFLDTQAVRPGETILGAKVVGTVQDLSRWRKKAALAFAVGDNAERRRLYQDAKTLGFQCPTLIHPTAFLEKSARVEEASVLCAGTVLAVSVYVGTGAIINTGAIIDHETTIGAFAHISTACAVAGRVTIGEGVFLGIGSKVIDKIEIGAWSTVGAGSVVVDPIPSKVTAYGVPARVQRV